MNSNLSFHLFGNFPSFSFPLPSIPHGVVQVFIARDTKHTTLVELFGKWNDVKVKEAKLGP
jgi:hypothetical protein